MRTPHPLLAAACAAAIATVPACAPQPPSAAPATTPVVSYAGLPVHQALIPAGRFGRSRVRTLRPRFITIHSTGNPATGANAQAHARTLQRGGIKGPHNSLGYVTWHFTVDQDSIYQSLPTNEQGQHADYEGPGNRTSIGIEMCENRGNSRTRTIELTARLTAELMRRFNIPLQNVVPHQHWLMVRHSDGRLLGHKNCPHFLLDHGQPGAAWRAFLARVDAHRRAGQF